MPTERSISFVDLLRGCVLHNDFAARLGMLYNLESHLTTMMQNALFSNTKVAHLYLFLQFISNLLVSSDTVGRVLTFFESAGAKMLAGGLFASHALARHKQFATLLLNISVHIFHGHQVGSKSWRSFRSKVCSERQN